MNLKTTSTEQKINWLANKQYQTKEIISLQYSNKNKHIRINIIIRIDYSEAIE
jgi:hypothetical protein